MQVRSMGEKSATERLNCAWWQPKMGVHTHTWSVSLLMTNTTPFFSAQRQQGPTPIALVPMHHAFHLTNNLLMQI
jgi:hypothetical protein